MIKEKIKKVVVGGTFDIFHKGHQTLLKRAFELGQVFIGLTSNNFAEKMKNRKPQDFKIRKGCLEKWVQEEAKEEVEIIEIEDEFGFTLNADFDYIIVSPETEKTAKLINQEREKRNLKPIEIVTIEFVLAEDGKPISSTRILNKEIDTKGKIIK